MVVVVGVVLCANYSNNIYLRAAPREGRKTHQANETRAAAVPFAEM